MLRFYSNEVKDKQENQVTYTYKLIEAKGFMQAKKMKEREDRHYQMINCTEILLYDPFCMLFC